MREKYVFFVIGLYLISIFPPDVLDELGDDLCVGLGLELVPLGDQELEDVLVVRDDAVVHH